MTESRAIAIACAAAVAIVAIAIAVIRSDSPARGAADHAAVVSRSSTLPGTPIPVVMPRKPVELAPPMNGSMPGDGTWVVGRQVTPGAYRTKGGRSCTWARLQGSPGAPWTLATNRQPQLGPQVVVLGHKDVAFTSQGCAPWSRIR